MVVSRLFREQDLQHLDPFDESEDDYEQEQKAIVERRPSISEADLFHAIWGFRASTAAHDALDHFAQHPELRVPPEIVEELRQRKPLRHHHYYHYHYERPIVAEA